MTMMTDEQALFRDAATGATAQQFMTSPIGIYLLRKADEDTERAKMDLLACDAFDSQSILKIQQRALIAQSFRAWLSEAVSVGAASEAALQEYDWHQ